MPRFQNDNENNQEEEKQFLPHIRDYILSQANLPLHIWEKYYPIKLPRHNGLYLITFNLGFMLEAIERCQYLIKEKIRLCHEKAKPVKGYFFQDIHEIEDITQTREYNILGIGDIGSVLGNPRAARLLESIILDVAINQDRILILTAASPLDSFLKNNGIREEIANIIINHAQRLWHVGEKNG